MSNNQEKYKANQDKISYFEEQVKALRSENKVIHAKILKNEIFKCTIWELGRNEPGYFSLKADWSNADFNKAREFFNPEFHFKEDIFCVFDSLGPNNYIDFNDGKIDIFNLKIKELKDFVNDTGIIIDFSKIKKMIEEKKQYILNLEKNIQEIDPEYE